MTARQVLSNLQDRVRQVVGYQRISDTIDDEEEIAHFTSWESCCKILDPEPRPKGKKVGAIALWAGEANCLNDPLEGKALLLFVQETSQMVTDLPSYVTGKYGRHPAPVDRQPDYDQVDQPHVEMTTWLDLRSILRNIYGPPENFVPDLPVSGPITASNAYLVSFCREADRLDLWRAYGGNAADGVSLVMPLREAIKRVTNAWSFYRVAYDDRSKARAWAVLYEPLKRAFDYGMTVGLPRDKWLASIRKILSPVLFLFKHGEYRSEREVRLMHSFSRVGHAEVNPNGRGTFIRTDEFFLDSPRCRLILGPTCEKPKRKAAVLQTYLAERFGKRAPTVQRSAVPFQ